MCPNDRTTIYPNYSPLSRHIIADMIPFYWFLLEYFTFMAVEWRLSQRRAEKSQSFAEKITIKAVVLSEGETTFRK